MAKAYSLALGLAFLLPGLAGALELKNVRSTYGPVGATRPDSKYLPGDIIFMMFDIEGLKADDKTNKARYVIAYELVDTRGTITKKETPQEILLTLGGGRVPGDLHLIIGPKQQAGKYKVKLTVTDRNSKAVKEHIYAFEILQPTFGLVGVTAQALGVPGQQYLANFALVNMGLEGKKKLPKVEITLRVLDENGKQLTQPMVNIFPRDLPGEVDLQKENFVPIPFPIYLNRPGRFIVAVDANDKISEKKVQLRIPLTVLDLSKFGSQAEVNGK